MKFRETKSMKFITVFMAVLILNQVFFPSIAYALTGGPSQPEVKGFTPIGASDMVDLFTGDFKYNIPLLDVDGYPLNLSYQSNPSMDDEASWVGLGWSLNPGVITRNMRGFPDDFSGDQIEKKASMLENKTYGGSLGFSAELFGIFGIGKNAGVYHNNYKGWGTSSGLTASINLGKVSASIGKSYDSQNGVDLSGSVNVGMKAESKNQSYKLGLGLSSSVNSRKGLKELAFSMSASQANGNTYSGENEKGETVPMDRTNSISTGTSFDFAGFTYSPTTGMPIDNVSLTYTGTVGGELFGVHGNLRFTGWGSEQHIRTPVILNGAFGYLNSEKLRGSYGLYDYNKTNQGTFRMDMPMLPFVFGTYDLFNASGQGVAGQFRAERNDVGVFRGGVQHTENVSGSLGIELGAGNAFHGGVDINAASVVAASRAWRSDNDARDVFEFTHKNKDLTSSTGRLYEPSFIKASGEFAPLSNPDFFHRMGDRKASFVQLDKVGMTVTADRVLRHQKNQKSDGTFSNLSGVQKKSKRVRRNSLFSFLSAEEAAVVGLDKKIYSYTTAGSLCNRIPFSRVDNFRKGHHMSEVTVTKEGGARYVYGIAAYNNEQVDRTFSVDNAGQTDVENSDFSLVSFTTKEITTNNESGRDHYFESQKIPAFSHSFLLTDILSPDYLDRTGDGISDDDLGSATKINYTRKQNNYKWRIPYKKARFQEGYKSKTDDNKASYLEGEKELWYVHSVEGKTQVAFFYTEPREDGLSTTGQTMEKLVKIELFSKSDLDADKPIKTIHFDYDYSLCPGVPNGTNGKLTLTKVWFSYGNNSGGEFNAYEFSYQKKGTKDGSFGYNIGHYDKWGNYQKNPNNYPNNMDYPYTIQSEAVENASAWSLNEIILPSGGKIKVEYEPDDYAYVQDHRAGEMKSIAGFADYVGGSVSNNLFEINGTIVKSTKPKKYIVVDDLPNSIKNLTENEIKDRYLAGIDEIYFKALVDLDNVPAKHEEYVFGYLSYDYAGVKVDNDKLYIPIEMTKGSKFLEMHPISKAALQLLRMNLEEYAYEALPPNTSLGFKHIIQHMANRRKEMRAMKIGYDRTKVYKGWAQKVVTKGHKSWLRLNNPIYKKYGGGSRVSKVSVYDSWKEMIGGNYNGLTIGQKYTYTTEGGYNQPDVISSGVASYEPSLGGDEISLRQPQHYEQNVKLAPDQFFYSETPVGEPLFPAPSVGYSKVTVSSINDNKTVVKRTGTGYSVSEFYTAKDFPVLSDYTNLGDGIKHVKPMKIKKLLKFKISESVTASQGYYVEVNDMHGKPKKEMIYDQNGVVLSSKEYFYLKDAAGHLSNTVSFFNSGMNKTEQGELGVDMDIWNEMQEHKTEVRAFGLSANLEAFVTPLPIVIPPLIPTWDFSDELLRTSVTTKLVKRFGILDKIQVVENGSMVTTKNILYDDATGSVLLTETQNEFDDPTYNFTYPAHWAYPAGMGQAYMNQGVEIGSFLEKNVVASEVVTFTDGVPATGTNLHSLNDGDELLLGINEADNTHSYIRGFILKNGSKGIIDINGNGINGDVFFIKVIRSARKNMASTPIGSIVSLDNPIPNAFDYDNSHPISTSAVTFTDDWNTKCKILGDVDKYFDLDVVNPFIAGLRGNWRPDVSYVFFNPRNQELTDNSLLRSRGDISLVKNSSFWKFEIHKWRHNQNNLWVGTNRITEFDLQGNEIENKDPLDISSSALFGYNNAKVVAISQNSEVNEIANDNFEDFFFNSECSSPVEKTKYFSLASKNYQFQGSGVTNDAAHTGKYSLGIVGEESACFYDIGCEPPCEDVLSFTHESCPVVQAATVKASSSYAIKNGSVRTCSGEFTDSGGSDDNYSPGEVLTFVVTPITSGSMLNVSFSEMDLTSGSSLKIYDGENGSLIADITGSTTGSYTATNDAGVLKFVFTSEFRTAKGWRGTFSCVEPQPDNCNICFTPSIENAESYTWTQIINGVSTVLSTQETFSHLFNDGEDITIHLSVTVTDSNGNTCTYESEQTFAVECGDSTFNCNELGFTTHLLDAYEIGFSPYGLSPNVSYSYFWDFGDGVSSTSTEFDPNYSYSSEGTYTVTLKVTTSTGEVCIYSEEIKVSYFGGNSAAQSRLSFSPYSLECADCLPEFSPMKNGEKEYLISVWVASESSLKCNRKIYGVTDLVSIEGVDMVMKTTSPVIDGWQQLQGKLVVPNQEEVCIKLKGLRGDKIIYYDDFRFQPWDSNMKSYVYDPFSLRLMAELDENNYATFYEYDDEGNLIRVKRETDDGIKTIQESRTILKENK